MTGLPLWLRNPPYITELKTTVTVKTLVFHHIFVRSAVFGWLQIRGENGHCSAGFHSTQVKAPGHERPCCSDSFQIRPTHTLSLVWSQSWGHGISTNNTRFDLSEVGIFPTTINWNFTDGRVDVSNFKWSCLQVLPSSDLCRRLEISNHSFDFSGDFLLP